MIDDVAQAEADGFSSYWVAQLASPDTLTAIALMGARTERIEIGTAVVPTWLRHPLMLATQALTVQEAIGNRLALGIGLAHKTTIETNLRIPFARPAKHMSEYLDVLLPAMADRAVDATGEIWSGNADRIGGMPGATSPAVLLAAMGPRMLAMAGARTDGTVLWLSGPKAIESQLNLPWTRRPPKLADQHRASWRACRCVSRTSPRRYETCSRRCSPATTTFRRTAA